MSKLLKKIQVATETGGKDLKNFAKVAGMSTKDFKKAFQKDAVEALSAFISGLNDTKRNGKSAIAILDDMGLNEVRLSNTILSLTNASKLLNDAVEMGSKSWEENTALTDEANKRYGDLKSQLIMALNNIKDIAITLGEKLMPAVKVVVDKIGEWAQSFSKLSDEEVQNIVNIGLLVAAISPLLTLMGKVITVGGTAIKGIGGFVEAIGVASGKITSTSNAVNNLAKVFTAITSPIGLACAGIGTAIAIIASAVAKSEEEVKKSFEMMGNSATDFINGIDTAQSHLDSFNETLFISSEEQQKMQGEMQKVQEGITNICKTASEERRALNESEIQKFDEYFTRLRELNKREVEIQQQISEAITQQAQTNAKAFEGSLEEYKTQSQEWIKTAEDQKKKTINLIDKQTIEETALLNQRFKTEDERQTEEYKKEYDKILAQKEEKIKQVNDEVSKIVKAYSDGYFERAKQNDSFYSTIQKYNGKFEEESQRHNEKLKWLDDNYIYTEAEKNRRRESENSKHQQNMGKIWEQIFKDMSEEQQKELGTWLAQVAQTELYGGKIEDETRNIVENIIACYDTLPAGTKTAMKNAMTPMLTEMQNKQPSLFAKASGIANGILSRLKRAFDIHSPSKKTRAIFKNVMKRNGERD